MQIVIVIFTIVVVVVVSQLPNLFLDTPKDKMFVFIILCKNAKIEQL